MPFINTKNIKIYYESAGKGEAVLYISGTGGDLRKSPSVFDNDLKNNFHLISYDQRGLGQSETPDGPYTMQDYADDAFNFIRKLGFERVNIIGVSFGGMVAQHLAINYPNVVEKLVLMCTSPGGKKYHSFPLHELEEIEDDLEYARKFISISDSRINDDYIKNNNEVYEFLINQIKNYLRSSESKKNQGKDLQLGARKDHNVLDLLKNIKNPTLIAGGLYDGIAPKSNIDILDELIPNSFKKFYKGGHTFFLEDQQAWEDVIKFLKN